MTIYTDATQDIDHILNSDTTLTTLQKIVDYLHDHFDHYSWVGIYLVQANTLHLTAWQGAQATEHIDIPIGEGICGSAAQSGRTEIINDVSTDPRYLSCFLSTKSEIVVPISKNDVILGEIDIDSDIPAAFTPEDKQLLEKIADMLGKHI